MSALISLQPVESPPLSSVDDTSAYFTRRDADLMSVDEAYTGPGGLSVAPPLQRTVKLHERYHFEDGTVQVEIEGVLYNIHRHFLEKDSSFFDLNDKESHSIVLSGIAVADFDVFLSIFYPKEYGSFDATTVKEWSAILNLADKWAFKRIRILAIKQLAPIACPVDIIVLGRCHSIDETGWRPVDAYHAICIRPDPLTLEEGNLLGMEDVIKIMTIRQEYSLGSRSHYPLPPPTLEQISRHFGLPDKAHTPTQASSLMPINLGSLERVKTLLTRFGGDNFKSGSDEIIAWVNNSEEKGLQVISLVCATTTKWPCSSDPTAYARLCRKMMRNISGKGEDDRIKSIKGKPVAGGLHFRQYLLTICREYFKWAWPAKGADTKASGKKVSMQTNDKEKDDDDDDKFFLKSRRGKRQKVQRRALIGFVGELYKLQMLPECFMHECVKTLLDGADNPTQQEVEGLCQLLGSIGTLFDNPNSRERLDAYFTRIKELSQIEMMGRSYKSLLKNIIILRAEKWVSKFS